MKLNLRGKIILPTICLFFITTSLSLLYIERQMRAEVDSLVFERLESELRTVVTGLNGMRDTVVMDLEGTALIRPVRLLLGSPLPEDELKETLAVLAFSLDTKPLLARAKPEIYEMNVLDRQGRIIMSSARGVFPLGKYKDGDAWKLNQQLPQSRALQLFAQAVKENKTVWGAPMDLEALAKPRAQGEPGKAFIPVTTPVRDSRTKEVIGAVEAWVDFSVLSASFVTPVKIKQRGEALVCADGALMISTGKFTMTPPGPTWRTPKWVKEKSGRDDYVFQDERWLALFSTDPQTRWTVTVKVSADEVLEPADRIVAHTRIANALSLLVVLTFLIFFATYLVRNLRKTVLFAEAVADGHLERTLDLKSGDEVGLLASALNRMVESLRKLIVDGERRASEAVEQTRRAEEAMLEAEESRKNAENARVEGIHHAAAQLENLVEELRRNTETMEKRIAEAAGGAERQRVQSSNNADIIDKMNLAVHKVSTGAQEASGSAARAGKLAEGGSGAVANVGAAIQEVNVQALRLKDSLNTLGARAEDIGKVMTVISDIADQTNLLALNAAIEAARAGDAGRGFAVVADEVRKLAEKTMTATKEVGESVFAIQGATRENIAMMDSTSATVNRTTELAQSAAGALSSIVDAVKTNAVQVEDIATAGGEQAENSRVLTTGIEEVDKISIATADLMREAAQSLKAVTSATENLSRLLRELKKN